jgi:hypothetical protein
MFALVEPITLSAILSSVQSRSSAVGIATVNGMDDRGIRVPFPVESRIFTFPYRPDRLWGAPNFPSSGNLDAFAGGQRQQQREADHSPPTSAEVPKAWV